MGKDQGHGFKRSEISAEHDLGRYFSGGTPKEKRENPFIGMWKDREDMAAVDPYLRELRANGSGSKM